MQQLAHAVAFLTAVTPPVYLSDVTKDSCADLRGDDRPVYTRHNRPAYRIKFHHTAA